MLVKQVSIFVENKEGKIANVLEILANNNINIKALSLADTTNFGILRLIVDKPQKTKEILNNEDIIVKINDVVTVGVLDRPGGLSGILKKLGENKLAIEYMYAFIGDNDSKAMVVLKIDDVDKAIKCINENNIPLITAEDIKQKWD